MTRFLYSLFFRYVFLDAIRLCLFVINLLPHLFAFLLNEISKKEVTVK